METAEDLVAIAGELEASSSTDILRWALARYRNSIVAACSFGGASGMVLLDQLLALDPEVPVFYLDTGLLHDETYAHVAATAATYRIAPIVVRSPIDLQEQEERYGARLWERDPDKCCALRKIDAQRRFLQGYSAWISGIRRDQTETRAQTPVVEWDTRFEIAKVNPLARWSEREIWSYIEKHSLSYNPLHDRGYSSIGCAPCTIPSERGDPRSGRWPGHAKTECGIHE